MGQNTVENILMEIKSSKQKCFNIFKIGAFTLTKMRDGDFSTVGLKASTLGN